MNRWFFSTLVILLPMAAALGATSHLQRVGRGNSETTKPVAPGFRLAAEYRVLPEVAKAMREKRAARRRSAPDVQAQSDSIDPAVRSLARGLLDDPVLMFDFVRNYIDTVPMYGFTKSPAMTLLDGSGSAWDQARLLKELLWASGYGSTYVIGWTKLTGEQVQDWLGSDDRNTIVGLLREAGWDYFKTTPNFGPLQDLRMEEVYLKLTLNGKEYLLDPAFKPHEQAAGIDLSAALGYDRASFTNRALLGATTTPQMIDGLDRQVVREDLGLLAANLWGFLKTNLPAASLEQIVGGWEIIQTNTTTFPTNLAYIDRSEDEWNSFEGDYSTQITIILPGYEEIYLTPEDIYGRCLTLAHTLDGSLYTPRLMLDGVVVGEGDPVPAGSYTCQVWIDHPYDDGEGTYADDEIEFTMHTDTTYAFVGGWGNTSRQSIEHHRRRLQACLNAGLPLDSEAVLGETLTLIGMTWMAETSATADLVNRISHTRSFRHHAFGVVAQGESPFIDIVETHGMQSLEDDVAAYRGAFYTLATLFSAFEWGVIDQMQPMSAVSTIKLLDQALAQGNTVFWATKENFQGGVLPSLVNYDPDVLTEIQTTLDAGDRWNPRFMVLPEHGDLQDGNYVGTAFYMLDQDGGLATRIRGGLNGGYGTMAAEVDPNYSAEGMTLIDNAADHPQSAEPVDLLTGHYLDRKVDLTVGGGDLPFGLSFARSYNSGRYHADGPLGRGWSPNLDITATIGSDGFRGLGSLAGRDASAAIAAIWINLDLLRDGLSRDALLIATVANRWFMDNLVSNVVNVVAGEDTVQFMKRWDESYTPTPGNWAQLEKQPDSSFRLTSKHGDQFDFDDVGKLQTWMDANSNRVSYAYSNGLLTSVTNHMGRSLHLSYDGENRLVEVSDHTGRKVTYEYDADGNLVGRTDPMGHTERYEYDIPGILTRIYHPSDPNTPYVENDYLDGYDLAKFRYHPTQVLRQTAVDGQTNTYYYAAGRRTREENAGGRVRTWVFNERGRIDRVIDALTNTMTVSYDGMGRFKKLTLPEGNGMTVEYGGADDEVSAVQFDPKPGSTEAPRLYRFTYEALSRRLGSVTDPIGRLTHYAYDSRGNLTRVELPEVESEVPAFELSVNGRGQVTAVTLPEGGRVELEYDALTGDQTSAVFDAGGANMTVRRSHDTVGNVIRITDPTGLVSHYDHDANRRVTNSVVAASLGVSIQTAYDPGGNLSLLERATGDASKPWQITRIDYSPLGGERGVTGPDGAVYTVQRDSSGRLWKWADPLNHTWEATYTARGQAFRLRDPTGKIIEEHTYTPNGRRASVRDGKGNLTQYSYDGFDRVRRTTFADGTYREFVYDAASRLVRERTRAGVWVDYEYDAEDRLTRKTVSGGEVSVHRYDLLGRLTHVFTTWTTNKFRYDGLNRLVSETQSEGLTVSHEYDAAGHQTKLTYPDGYYVTYAYDALGRVEEIRENGTKTLATFSYDALSRQTRTLCGNGVITESGYGEGREITRRVLEFATNTVEFGYEYDAAGQLRRWTSSDPDFVWMPRGSEEMERTVNALNQYSSSAGTALSYDANGNLTGDGVHTHTFDQENRLTRSITPDHQVTFRYDGLGRLVRRVSDGESRTLVYSGTHLIEERDESGTLMRRYVHAPGLDAVLSVETGEGKFYCHRNPLNSVVALSDETGGCVEVYAYSPFGRPARASRLGNPFLFQGRPYDEVTGLYDFRARYYSPSLGRFLSPDPVGHRGGGANLYTFVGNAPVNLSDNLGLWYPNVGGGYLDDLQTYQAALNKSGGPVGQKMAEELQSIMDTLNDYAKAVKNQKGNCQSSFRDFRELGFFEAVKDLNYFEVKEIAGGWNAEKESYNHFAIAITKKGSRGIEDVKAIFDPIGHLPVVNSILPKGWKLQIQDSWRQWNSQAWRDPEVWLNSVIPTTYGGNSQYYLGGGTTQKDQLQDIQFLTLPYIPGHEFYGKTYNRQSN